MKRSPAFAISYSCPLLLGGVLAACQVEHQSLPSDSGALSGEDAVAGDRSVAEGGGAGSKPPPATGADGASLLDGGEGSADGTLGGSAFDGAVGVVTASDAGIPVDAGVPARTDVLAVMRRAADYQIAAGPGAAHPDWVNKWPEAVFYAGVMATYQATADAKYLTAATQWGQNNQFTLLGGTTTPPTRSADNQCAGQAYTEIFLTNPQATNSSTFIQNTKAAIDAMIANPSAGRVDWWWCDALFMAPPVVARLGAITSQAQYFQFLDTMWSDASNNLFDPTKGLFWRDSTFFQTNTYWSRGNGWVMGGAVRVLEYLPMTDANRSSYVTLLQTMAASVRPLQGADGLWRSDLLHPAMFPNPETSGTALFCYAVAWGVRQGTLDRGAYLPMVVAAWQGLVANVSAQGRLGYVQGTGSAPAAAAPTDSFDYGVGAFLLAGSEVAQLSTP